MSNLQKIKHIFDDNEIDMVQTQLGSEPQGSFILGENQIISCIPRDLGQLCMDMHDVNISSTYTQLANSPTLFLGRLKVKDQHGKLLDEEMEIVVVDVEIISAKSDLPIDKEFLIKDTDLPLVFYRNGENSTDLVNNDIVDMSRTHAPDGKKSS